MCRGGTAGNDALERESFSVVRKLSKDPRSPLSYGMCANAHMDAVVCAMGAKAVYEYQLSRHKRRGLSESEAQRCWLVEAAKSEPQGSTRIVAVSGSLARLRALDLPFPIGFDQSGYLVRRFAIAALPARVRLDAHGGEAEEIPLDEKGRVIPGRAMRLPDLLWGRPGEPDRYLPTETP